MLLKKLFEKNLWKRILNYDKQEIIESNINPGDKLYIILKC